jgi:putative hydrolase of the HAD superfamily
MRRSADVMPRQPFDLIAFDGDDTLWHNERSYRDGRVRFSRVLAAAGVLLTEDEIEDRVNQTELRNLAYYGYGISSFILSLIETAIELTDGRVSGQRLGDLIVLARQMITAEIELFPGAADALAALATSYPLMLITKGDLLHQRSKVDRSGLHEHFRYVEVVSHKTPEVYSAILSRYGVEPSRFLMVGNSLRSDVLPVVEVGGWAVYVPAALTWSHEHADPTEEARQRYFERPTLEGLPEFVAGFGRTRPSRGRGAGRVKGAEPTKGTASRLVAGIRGAAVRRLSVGATERKKR